jgi:hypothetical protein
MENKIDLSYADGKYMADLFDSNDSFFMFMEDVSLELLSRYKEEQLKAIYLAMNYIYVRTLNRDETEDGLYEVK